jgi:uncharacterized membrane protein YgcG
MRWQRLCRRAVTGGWHLSWLIVVLFSAQALAEERIRDFNSDIQLHANGDVEVTETIRVNVEHQAIRHGIYRDFPTRYKDNNGLTNNIVGFSVEEVLLDGQPVPFQVQSLSNGKRIKIGSAQYRVPLGEHEYRIRYRTNRQIAFAGGLARFWWNVTGNGWRFPIDHARVVIHTPQGAAANAVEQKAWLGPVGSTDSSGVTLSQPDHQTLVAESRRTIRAGEGLTVWYLFPEKYFHKPTLWENIQWFFRDNFFGILGFLGLLWFPWFYYRAWDRVGRDPAKGAVMARFKPPRDLSPAAVRYIWKEGADNKTFSAALLNLAVKGFLKLKKLGWKSYQLDKTTPEQQKATNRQPPSVGERMVYSHLHSRETLGKSYNPRVKKAKEALARYLKREYQNACYRDNSRYSWIGLFISLILLALFWYQFYGSKQYLAVYFLGAVAIIITTVVGMKAHRGLITAGLTIFPWIAIMGFQLAASQQQDFYLSKGFFAVVLVLVVLNGLFAWLLKAPTPFGRKVLDEIEGFRLFLSTTEQNRFEKMHPPEKTPELFEKYLPYALALDVENQWAEQFEDVLKAASNAPDSGYHPAWYSSYDGSAFSPRIVTSSLASGLASSVAAASTPPSSSGGSGGFSGGGFSGGGGGGGGGGGW